MKGRKEEQQLLTGGSHQWQRESRMRGKPALETRVNALLLSKDSPAVVAVAAAAAVDDRTRGDGENIMRRERC